MNALATAIVLICPAFVDETGGKRQLLVGADLVRQRQQPVTLTWQGVPVRDGLADLARAESMAVLLDRRIDPGLPLSFSAHRKTLDELLVDVAHLAGGEATWLSSLAYLGPADAASRLRTLAALRAADVLALPKDRRTKFQRSVAMSWQTLTEPRRLVANLAAEAGVSIEPLEIIEHDLWAAADLPPLSWTDRLTLVLNEFDLTFEFADENRLRLKAINQPVVVERSYPRGKQAAEVAERWRQLAPEAEIKVSSGNIIVRGRLEDHELLVSKRPMPKAATTAGVEVYSLKIEATPLSAVLDHLRKQLSVDIRVDEAALEKAKLSLDRPVSFSVEQVGFDELLKAALQPADLDFVRQGNAYLVVPRR